MTGQKWKIKILKPVKFLDTKTGKEVSLQPVDETCSATQVKNPRPGG